MCVRARARLCACVCVFVSKCVRSCVCVTCVRASGLYLGVMLLKVGVFFLFLFFFPGGLSVHKGPYGYFSPSVFSARVLNSAGTSHPLPVVLFQWER